MFEIRVIDGEVTKPGRVPTLDSSDLSLRRSDFEPAPGVAAGGGVLQHRGEGVGLLGHALSERGVTLASTAPIGLKAREPGGLHGFSFALGATRSRATVAAHAAPPPVL